MKSIRAWALVLSFVVLLSMTSSFAAGPSIAFGNYYGGSNRDVANAVAVDASGNMYIAGQTSSTDFPTLPAATLAAGQHAFLTKTAPDGTVLYSTVLAGSHTETINGMVIDTAGNAWVVGTTNSGSFLATPFAVQSVYRGGDTEAFVAEFSPTGALVYFTYLGGSGADSGTAIAIDSARYIIVAGQTCSEDFPVAGDAVQSELAGNCDAFVSKIDYSTGTFPFSTYFGGAKPDVAFGVAVDARNDIFITGATNSGPEETDAGPGFPILNAMKPTFSGPECVGGNGDGFVAKISADGGTLFYSTYFGGSGCDEGRAIAVDSLASAYVTGMTESTNFNTSPGAFQSARGGVADAFVIKVSPTGAALQYGTYLGGEKADQGNSIAVDVNGIAYVAGSTQSANFPVANPLQAIFGGGSDDGFFAKVSTSGGALIESTFIGGVDADYANAVTVDSAGEAFAAGETNSVDLFSAATYHGNGDAFMMRLTGLKAAAITVAPKSLLFGDQLIGTSSEVAQVITITNVGDSELTLMGIDASGDFSQYNNCGTSLPASPEINYCEITVTFAPSKRGVLTGSVTVQDNAPGSPHVIALTGHGAAPVVSLPASVDFDKVKPGDMGTVKSIPLTNTGDGLLSITDIQVSGDFVLMSSGDSKCSTTWIDPGVSCNIYVAFAPKDTGIKSGTLKVTELSGTVHNVVLTGEGGDPAASGPDFNLTAVTPTVVMTVGSTAKFTVSVAPISGFSQAVTFTCAGAPWGSTCAVEPASVTLDGATTSPVAVMVRPNMIGAVSAPANSPFARYELMFGMLAFGGFMAVGRKHRWWIVFALVLIGVVMLCGCGGGGKSVVASPSGTYNLVLTGTTSGTSTVSHSINLELQVK